MKLRLTVFGMVGFALFILSSFSSETKKDDQKEPQKTRHIKMTKIENGKRMELDTVVNEGETFVWDGDTIDGKPMVKHFGHFGPKGMKNIEMFMDGDKGDKDVMIYRSKGNDVMFRHMNPKIDIEDFAEGKGDSISERIIFHKQFKDEDGHNMMFFTDSDEMPFLPLPPVPPVPHIKMFHYKQPGRIIDLNDPNIVSYRKKDMKGNMEKIEIVRKNQMIPEI